MAADVQYASANGVRLAYEKAGDGYPLPRAGRRCGLLEEWFVAGNKISTPVCVLWSERGPVARYPVLKVWRTAVHDVRRAMIPRCAHYLQEEQPDLVVRHILRFAKDLGIP